ncbi:MOB kinase activator 3B isoform X3 [Salmo salar]|uniref:MOB kinase activator 3B isoform X3 n=1 Tax=Salmo salar TaxID=8030 RepID=A0A1S3LUG7_SALSA|nr:MOB kinase activator 3B isoform X3 [Salmo salar]|eukprot:XP_013994475.1 PREDICTED: MOB kinase activator 3B isoform X3 [Salmo salar]
MFRQRCPDAALQTVNLTLLCHSSSSQPAPAAALPPVLPAPPEPTTGTVGSSLGSPTLTRPVDKSPIFPSSLLPRSSSLNLLSSLTPVLAPLAPVPANMSIALKQVFNKDKTFRPKRKFEPGTQRFELHKKAQVSLSSGVDLRAAVALPHGEDLNDWVAVHVVDFFNRINLIYGTVCEFCTEKSCPVMSGGPRYEYRWQDDHKYKKPTALPAPKYMNLLMDWIEVQINNEDIFPTSIGIPFPKNFIQICKKIICRLFRVFVHVYIHHFDRMMLMGAEAHVNTCYKHFYYFSTELNLIDRKELEPLKDMTSGMCH